MRLQNANGPIAIIGPVRFLSSIAVHILTGHLIDCNERRSLAKNNTAGSKIIIRRQSLQIEMILLGISRISMHGNLGKNQSLFTDFDKFLQFIQFWLNILALYTKL